eukprot:2681939-Heterocapsa_arctica.AAC.1
MHTATKVADRAPYASRAEPRLPRQGLPVQALLLPRDLAQRYAGRTTPAATPHLSLPPPSFPAPSMTCP